MLPQQSGMESLFRQLGIYSASGQLYQPEDSDKVMWYKEDKKGRWVIRNTIWNGVGDNMRIAIFML
jgi:pyruvate dehydrogenase complex dehydrogenase (E1) component